MRNFSMKVLYLIKFMKIKNKKVLIERSEK